MTHRNHGFTLIELAIAITVIGLLMAGVLMGSNALIEKSRMASLISKTKDLGAASRDFKSRYGYFPGDMPNAGTYITADGGLSSGCASGGGGNGVVDTELESTCALEHLVKSGLISKAEHETAGYFIGSGFEGGMVGSVFKQSRVSLWHTTANDNVIRITMLPCTVALALDRKLDNDYSKSDGTPVPLGKGNVTGTGISGTTIETCRLPGTNGPDDPGENDPAPALLVKY